MNRRLFLRNTLLYTTAPLLIQALRPMQLFASSSVKKIDHLFLMIHIYGGCDVTLGLDPQFHSNGATQNDIFIEYRRDQIRSKGNIQLGPAAEALSPFCDDICVINGIRMQADTHSHQAIASGNLPDAPSNWIGAELALKYKLSEQGVFHNAAGYIGVGAKSQSFGNKYVTELISQEAKNLLMKTQPGEDSTRTLFEKPNSLEGYLDFIAHIFRENIYYQAHLSVSEIFNSLNLGSAYNNLDSHRDHEKNHLNAQKFNWEFIAQLFKIFKQTEYLNSNLFNHTTFCVVNEFSRTPALNSTKGKDHNIYTNSVLLAGKGVQGNQTIGQSYVVKRKEGFLPQHKGAAYDYRDQKSVTVRENITEHTSYIHPGNVAQTIYNIFGIKSSISPQIDNSRPLTAALRK